MLNSFLRYIIISMFRKKRGFTLIELLVVVAIISLLSSIVMASLNSARSKSRDARRKSDLHQVRNALALYYDTNGSYPVARSFSSWASNWSNFGSIPGTIGLYNGLVGGGFIAALPADPVNKEGTAQGGPPGGNFLGDNAPIDQAYVYDSDGTTYTLGTNLENGGGIADNRGNYQLKLQ